MPGISSGTIVAQSSASPEAGLRPSRPIRVMYVVSAGYPGGGLHSVAWLARSLDRSRYEVSLVCPDSPTTERLASAAGIRRHPLEFSLCPRPGTIRRLARLINTEQVDILHTHLLLGDLYGALAMRLVRVPLLVSTIQGVNFFWEMEPWTRKAGGWVASRVYRGIYRAFDGIVAPSEAVKEAVCSRPGIRVMRDRVRMIHHGIDVAQLRHASQQPLDRDAWSAAAPADPRIVTVANFDPFKGHRVLLEALRRLRRDLPVQCLLIGEGPARPALEARSQAMGLGDTVRFLGCRDDVPAILRGADLFVFPSLWEPLGIAVLEAMALAKPVIACAAGGIPEIITDGDNGLLTPPGNPEALAEAIKRLLTDRPLAAALSRRGQETVERRFDVRQMASAHEQWYEALLARKGVIAAQGRRA